MTDWSHGMADKLKKRIQNQAIKDEKFLETQRIRREIGPKLWDAIKSDISAEVRSLNLEMGQEIITTDKRSSPNELSLIAQMNSEIRRCLIRFELESGKLTWETLKGVKDSVELVIGLDNKMAFQGGMVPYSTGSLARQILEALLD